MLPEPRNWNSILTFVAYEGVITEKWTSPFKSVVRLKDSSLISIFNLWLGSGVPLRANKPALIVRFFEANSCNGPEYSSFVIVIFSLKEVDSYTGVALNLNIKDR